MGIVTTVKNEIDSYVSGEVRITDRISFSQYRTVRHISNFANRTYPSGNVDSQGNYKYWFDIISPRIDNETKNIDFDTSDITLYSEMKSDRVRVMLSNALLREWMKETQQGVSLNEDIENCTGWGNMIWKKVKGGKLALDLTDTYVINQKAKTLSESPVIERHLLTSSQLRAKRGIYNEERVDELLKSRGNVSYVEGISDDKGIRYYELFERNGEVSVEDYNEARRELGQGEIASNDPENEFILAKSILCLMDGGSGGKLLFVERLKSMDDIYVEYHRGRYVGRWLRVGFYEMLMDIQIRANEIGNQIARALEYGAIQLFTSSDDSIYRNVLTDLQRGDIVKAKDLRRLDMSMQDISNYIAEWNQLMQTADRLTNSTDIASGEEMPSGMPFKLGNLLNQNSNKLYNFIREKLALSFKSIYENWILPELLKDFGERDVVRITGDSEYLDLYREALIEEWYIRNLVALGPHTSEEAKVLKERKAEQLGKSKEELVRLGRDFWKDYKARVSVNITGESVNINTDIESRNTLLALEPDPIRKSALLDQIYTRLGIDMTKLPKAQPQNMQVPQGKTVMPTQ